MRSSQRLAALLFSAALAALFLVVALSEGIGRPGVPAGAVAVVEDLPGESGTISTAEFRQELRRAGVEAGLGGTPRPGEEGYGELRDLVLTSLLTTAWTEAQAAEMGASVHPVEVDEAFREYRQRFLQSDAAYRRYLARTGQTTADVKNSVRIGLLQTEIARQVRAGVPAPSDDEVESYYEEVKQTRFTLPPRRDVRIVVSTGRGEAERAKRLLERDDSRRGWARAARRFSEDPSAGENGGEYEALTEEALAPPLDEALFDAPVGRVEGPLRTPVGYYVFEVVEATPGGAEPLSEDAESGIRTQLAEQDLDEALDGFQYDFESRWRARTACAAGYRVAQVCGNAADIGRPPGASPACYRAHPRKAPPACPAPVAQLQPALPGSVSLLEPAGERLPQRPRPAGLASPPEPPPFFPGAPGKG
jgi:parvulin-like peptidyl-prolyl isomerase